MTNTLPTRADVQAASLGMKKIRNWADVTRHRLENENLGLLASKTSLPERGQPIGRDGSHSFTSSRGFAGEGLLSDVIEVDKAIDDFDVSTLSDGFPSHLLQPTPAKGIREILLHRFVAKKDIELLPGMNEQEGWTEYENGGEYPAGLDAVTNMITSLMRRLGREDRFTLE